MKKITKTTHYWLFKPVHEDAHESELYKEYMYIRVQNEGETNYSWQVGYENSLGDVNLLSISIMSDVVLKLEEEFQKDVRNIEPVHQLIREGLFLQAIRDYKNLTGCSLREAKDYVDNNRNNAKL